MLLCDPSRYPKPLDVVNLCEPGAQSCNKISCFPTSVPLSAAHLSSDCVTTLSKYSMTDSKKGENKTKYRSQAAGTSGGVTSASGLQSGDVGIFVTCDKGKEKACLREMEDLVSEVLGLGDDYEPNDLSKQQAGTNDEVQSEQKQENQSTEIPSTEATGNGSIEDEIQRELAEMADDGIVESKKRKRPDGDAGDQDYAASTTSKRTRLGLIMLDIPCVSFVRFPPGTQDEPIDIVMKLCKDAKDHPGRQRSRFVKRLTPLSKVRKVMSGGIEELCRDILPAVFGGEDGPAYKYAVKLTVRNNNQVSKEEIIKTVATEVAKLGMPTSDAESRHKVDLKGFDKLVMVDIYRNIVGMAVVGDEWEALRRFNLAEIYADGRKENDTTNGKESGHEVLSDRRSTGAGQSQAAPIETPS